MMFKFLAQPQLKNQLKMSRARFTYKTKNSQRGRKRETSK